MIRLLAMAALLFLSAPAGMAQDAAEKPASKVFNAESFALENGMRVIVIPNHRAPVVMHMLWYKVGAADEPPGVSGIAHFLEHLMFKGSGDLKPGEFSETVRGLGGQDNAFTGHDYTAFHQSVAVEHLEKMMRMEAGRVRDLHPPAGHVASEHKVILEERRQRIDNDPYSRFNEQMNAALFVHHPYGTPVIGWMHEMEALTWDDAKNFYDRWYGPNNAILVITGDVEGREVFKLAQEIYGKLEPSSVPERHRTQSPPLPAAVTLRMTDPEIRQPLVQIAYRVPGYRMNSQDSLALQVLEDIMSNGSSARLYKSLVAEQKIATGAGLSYDSAAWDESSLRQHATPAAGHSPEETAAALETQIRLLAAEGVTQAEIAASIKRLQAQAVLARDSLSGPAMIVGRALITGSTLEDIESWPQNIAKVTTQQVQDVARRYLDPGRPGVRPVTGYLLPQPAPEATENTQEEKTP